MRIDQKTLKRFEELLDQGSHVMQTRTPVTGGFPVAYRHGMVRNPPDEKLNSELAVEWGVRCLNFLKRVAGIESDHYQRFKEQSDGFEGISNYSCVPIQE